MSTKQCFKKWARILKPGKNALIINTLQEEGEEEERKIKQLSEPIPTKKKPSTFGLQRHCTETGLQHYCTETSFAKVNPCEMFGFPSVLSGPGRIRARL